MFARYLIISAGLAIAAPLAAESPDVENPPQIVVAYGDLDLTRQADVEELNRRINRAANRVCPFENSKMALSRLLVAKKCVSEAIERTPVTLWRLNRVDIYSDRTCKLASHRC